MMMDCWCEWWYIYVWQVHPFHVSESSLRQEGYHDRYPNDLFTYKELDIFNKYTAWPAYFATPLCRLFNASDCEYYEQ